MHITAEPPTIPMVKSHSQSFKPPAYENAGLPADKEKSCVVI